MVIGPALENPHDEVASPSSKDGAVHCPTHPPFSICQDCPSASSPATRYAKQPTEAQTRFSGPRMASQAKFSLTPRAISNNSRPSLHRGQREHRHSVAHPQPPTPDQAPLTHSITQTKSLGATPPLLQTTAFPGRPTLDGLRLSMPIPVPKHRRPLSHNIARLTPPDRRAHYATAASRFVAVTTRKD